ncbi:MAG: PIN domain-containing protein [Anaerolineae bacterium]|nr:PIN domain-containing protein [Anaerolineae bacterium]
MDRLIYVIDTNVVIDYLRNIPVITEKVHRMLSDDHYIYLCQPVYYEIMRGFIRANSGRKRTIFEQKFRPMLHWVRLTDADWTIAAQFWAEMMTIGRQISDIDLLIAAITKRLGGILVTSDKDFDDLSSITRENWRIQS